MKEYTNIKIFMHNCTNISPSIISLYSQLFLSPTKTDTRARIIILDIGAIFLHFYTIIFAAHIYAAASHNQLRFLTHFTTSLSTVTESEIFKAERTEIQRSEWHRK